MDVHMCTEARMIECLFTLHCTLHGGGGVGQGLLVHIIFTAMEFFIHFLLTLYLSRFCAYSLLENIFALLPQIPL